MPELISVFVLLHRLELLCEVDVVATQYDFLLAT